MKYKEATIDLDGNIFLRHEGTNPIRHYLYHKGEWYYWDTRFLDGKWGPLKGEPPPIPEDLDLVESTLLP